MILVEVCLVICITITLFSILNRLCAICGLLEDIKKLITNPNIVLPDEVVKHIAELLKAARVKRRADRG